jgi:MFS family permease
VIYPFYLYIRFVVDYLNLGFLTESKINGRNLASVTLLNIGALSWFFVFIFNMDEIFVNLAQNTELYGNYVGNSLVFGSAIFWSIAISFIGMKINRRKLLFTSTILGIFSTVLLAFVKGPFSTSIAAFSIGTSLGLFLPSSMALVADNTIVENRGRVSGIVILSIFIVAFFFLFIYRLIGYNLLGLVLLLVVVRSISLFGLLLGKFDKQSTIGGKKLHLHSDTYKEFILYLCPWVIFTFASDLGHNLISGSNFAFVQESAQNLRYVFIAVFGLASGYIADRYGRKQPIFLGLFTMGIGSILLTFGLSEITINIYYVLSGITWGLFFVVFLVVPGDLSPHFLREKFYSIGYILPVTALFAFSTIPVINIQEILDQPLIPQIVFGCLFLAMLPVFRAKETLAESKIQARKMKEYTERVGKIIHETEEGK